MSDELDHAIFLDNLGSFIKPRKKQDTKSLPKSFKIFNHTIKVEYRDDLIDKLSAYGLWVERDLTIYVDTTTPKTLIQHTLYHEIMHAMLDLTGHSELSQDERFVDCLGDCLSQVVSTLK